MNKKIEKALEDLESAYESSALALADHLRTVADNGPEYATTKAVAEQADSVKGWADWVLKALSRKKSKTYVICTGNVCDGFKFYGPFDDANEAVDFASDNYEQWDVIPIEPPKEYVQKEGDLVEP